jgi:hypothetical protein
MSARAPQLLRIMLGAKCKAIKDELLKLITLSVWLQKESSFETT